MFVEFPLNLYFQRLLFPVGNETMLTSPGNTSHDVPSGGRAALVKRSRLRHDDEPTEGVL